MNWKEVPHLFANGKFTFRYRGRVCQMYWYNNVSTSFKLVNDFWPDSKNAYLTDETLKLIARKIEDMTGEELKECPNLIDIMYEIYNSRPDKSTAIPHLRKRLIGLLYRFDIKMHLLSIGVYPFDQSHFGETVIDINTL